MFRAIDRLRRERVLTAKLRLLAAEISLEADPIATGSGEDARLHG